ncbi:MAG: insulinase family protein [Oscillospiraceae bacterium]
MERTRDEIMPGVWLTAINTDKFKTDTLSVTLLTQLSAETAAMNALIPSVLRRGTTRCPDMDALSALQDELYGALVLPSVRRIGEIQAVGFLASFAGDAYLPGDEGLTERVSALVGELLLSPNTRGGLFLPDYVAGERSKLVERILARVNDKGRYAILRLIENMCSCEDFAVNSLGDESSAEAINYQKLTKHYHSLLAASPIEIFYCGGAKYERVREALLHALYTLPRGELDFDLGTDVRMNALEAEPRYFTEELNVTQGKLAIGWRLGDCMDDPDPAALRVFNAVFGGSVTSKLFTNVRERLSLCYYASSAVDLHKGLLLVSSGIEFDKYDAAKDEIFAQLEAIKRGEISDAELFSAKKSVASDLRASMDSAEQLESWWLSQNLDGSDCSPDELALLCESVTREEIIAIANGVECDAVYFLKNAEGDAADDE